MITSKYSMSDFSWECLSNKGNSNCRFANNVIRKKLFRLLYFECDKILFITVIPKRNNDVLGFILLIA